MTTITFYEKPGCGGNARQKAILEMAGHTVVAKNLLLEPWTRQRLIEFLDQLPVAHWFNRAAPEVKSGEIAPEKLDREAALSLLLNHPLLIRRPLMQAEDGVVAEQLTQAEPEQFGENNRQQKEQVERSPAVF